MSRRQKLIDLHQSVPHVLPSLLLCDFGNLAREVELLEKAGVGALHLDVMDGSFVPNLTYGMPVVSAFRGLTDMPLDVHLMIEHPERYITQFYEAGADVLTIHIEAVDDPRPAFEQIHRLGAAAGLALNPETPLDNVIPYLDTCDLLLVMSVDAGFGGQEFNPVAIEKLTQLKAEKPEHVVLEVDGGVNANTITECGKAGADLFVVGSAIFKQNDYSAAVVQLLSLIS